MRIVVLGGTRFIGRAIVDALVAAGHEPLVCHRGETEPEGLPDVPHLHFSRSDLAASRPDLEAFEPDAVIDCMAMSERDARSLLEALPDPGLHRVVLSSADVYRAFATSQHGFDKTGTPLLPSDPIPITEDAPLRTDPANQANPEYSKIAVERTVLEAGAIVLRLPMTYGPRDYQRREEWVLRRVRAGRDRIPVGPCNGLLPWGFVEDIAQGVVRAAEHRDLRGAVYNLGSATADPVAVWARRILAAAGWDAELVPVGAGTPLPADLWMTQSMAQPLLISTERARAELGYTDTDPEEAVAVSVRWHLAHPPEDTDQDLTADDEALLADPPYTGANA